MAQPTRKLAAIISADIAGYSAWVERDPAAAAAAVTKLRDEAQRVCAAGGGRIFNTAGDGLMLEFASATHALQAALSLCEIAQDQAQLRFGVHLGEVTQTIDGDLLGHGVNVAARLQAEAGPRTILVSQIVRDNAAPELAERLVPRGKIKLAKMRTQIAVFALDPAGHAVVARRTTPLLAVLAFDAQARDHATRALSTGVSEEILYAVSRIPSLKVLGSTSSFAFRGRDKQRAAKTLNATHVLDGSVRRDGERVRIAANLTEAESGVVLWSERYDRELGDALALQEDIAIEVAKALAVTLGESSRVRAPKLTAALSDAYFEARQLMRTGATVCVQTAAAALDGIVREAPDFARAWAALATAKLEVLRLSRADRARLVDDAREAAERALGVDPAMGEAYAVLAALESEFLGRWNEREALLAKALAAEPNNPLLLFRHGQFLISVGRVHDGYAQQARAFELDPLDPMLAAFHGYNVWSKTSKADGRAILEEAATRYPDNVFVWFMRQNIAALDGDFATASALRQHGERLIPGLTDSAAHKAGQRMQELMMAPSPEAFIELGEDFAAMAESEPAAALDLAVALSVLGMSDAALAIFEEALDDISAWRASALEAARPHIGYETALLFIDQTRSLRMNPAFAGLTVRLGLARYWRESSGWPDCASEVPYDFKAACGA